MNNSHTVVGTLRHVAGHAAVTVLAVAIALSLPTMAQYILFRWWPKVEGSTHLLLLNEISFGALLVLLFNLILSAREGQLSHRKSRLISLAYVRQVGGWLTRRFDRDLLERISGTRDIFVMSVTGYDVFVAEHRHLQKVIDDSFELRVLLLNPYAPNASHRVQSLPGSEDLLARYRQECESTIGRLTRLAAAGKKVSLKFYDDPPLWNLIVTGEYVWVQYCHDGHEFKSQPEYVFELNKSNPAQGLFPAFYVHFLNNWSNRNHPDYDFATGTLVYRNEEGNEVRRQPFRTENEMFEPSRLAFMGSELVV